MTEMTPQEQLIVQEQRTRELAFRSTHADTQPKGIFEHRDAVPWFVAPMPRRWHRCQWQTWGVLAWSFTLVHRCACGAIRRDGGPWTERNSRRKAG